MTNLRLLLALVLSAVVAGTVVPAAMSARTPSPTLQAGSSRFGALLFDGHGFVLYAFTRDPRGKGSRCYGACAAAWPPYLARGRLAVKPGLRRSLLGTTKRRDGKLQVTYDGRPLYYYVGDRNPGDILCQNVAEYGGTWLVVRPTGKLVR